jgi:hypothetical protein
VIARAGYNGSMRSVGVVMTLALGCGRVGFNDAGHVGDGSGSGDATATGITRAHVTAPGSMTTVNMMSFAVDPAPGSLLIVMDYETSCGPPGMISDTQNTTWSSLPSSQTTCPYDARVRMFYAMVAGGPDTITTYCPTTGGVVGAIAVEYMGVDPNVPIDSQSNQSGSTATTTANAGALSVTRPTVIVAALADASVMGTLVPGAPFAMLANDDSIPLVVEEATVAPGSYTPTAALTASDSCWFGAAAALRPR